MRTIISASRRTDIPAFYTPWFMNRIRAAFCCVANPFNPTQVSTVSLRPEDIGAIVFWTRNARPLLDHLDELNERGYSYYFHYTITGYPRVLEPSTPSIGQSLRTFAELAEKVGPDRVIWRYDPLLISNVTDFDFHAENFARLASALKAMTRRVVVGTLDEYRAAMARLRSLGRFGLELTPNPQTLPHFDRLVSHFVSCARGHQLEIVSCADHGALLRCGIPPGKCVDDALVARLLGVEVSHARDKGQRKHCRCVESKDIGAYDTCLHACRYCYASQRVALSLRHPVRHDPDSPLLSR